MHFLFVSKCNEANIFGHVNLKENVESASPLTLSLTKVAKYINSEILLTYLSTVYPYATAFSIYVDTLTKTYTSSQTKTNSSILTETDVCTQIQMETVTTTSGETYTAFSSLTISNLLTISQLYIISYIVPYTEIKEEIEYTQSPQLQSQSFSLNYFRFTNLPFLNHMFFL